ncbi:putative protein isoform X1 [Gossypium australe]|uniref:Uncharacterized protein n=1 Tax=Gossypium australe TaxID=47621 RepID=A0A5B6VPF3_9ROSI|nr:putative protein isoform X1 [Gossypium australe]
MNALLSLKDNGSEFQNDDSKLVAKRELVQSDSTAGFTASDNGLLYLRNRLCVLGNSELK